MQDAPVIVQELYFKKRIQLSVLQSAEEEDRWPQATNGTDFVTIMSSYSLKQLIYQAIQTNNGVANATVYAIRMPSAGQR